MKLIKMKKGAGKTTELIKLADNYDGYIVCRGVRECENIMKRANKIGAKVRYPMTYCEFYEGKYLCQGVKKVYIDDLDAFYTYMLNQVTGVKIVAATITVSD